MRPAVLLSLVAAVAANNYTFPNGFTPDQIELATRSSWCTAERGVCPQICGGEADENSCEPDDLSFSCTCEDGSDADVESYMNTIPYFVCQANYGNCISDHPDDADGQDQCKKDNQCGSKNATEAASTSSSSSSSSTASSSASSMPSSVDSVASGSSTTPTSTPNAALLQEHSTGLMAMALFLAARMVL